MMPQDMPKSTPHDVSGKIFSLVGQCADIDNKMKQTV